MSMFWTGGRDAAERGLREAHERRLEELRLTLSQAPSETEREEAERRLAARTREHHARMKELKRSLY